MSEDYTKLVTDEWDFGKEKALADKLKDLVIVGKKVATVSLYRGGDKASVIGSYASILDSEGYNFCIIQYTNSFIKPFLEINFNFALLSGEGYRDLEDWRAQHREFFKREYGFFDDNSLIICDQFRVVEIF